MQGQNHPTAPQTIPSHPKPSHSHPKPSHNLTKTSVSQTIHSYPNHPQPPKTIPQPLKTTPQAPKNLSFPNYPQLRKPSHSHPNPSHNLSKTFHSLPQTIHSLPNPPSAAQNQCSELVMPRAGPVQLLWGPSMNHQALVLGPEGLSLLREPKGSPKTSESIQKILSSIKEMETTFHCREWGWEHPGGSRSRRGHPEGHGRNRGH